MTPIQNLYLKEEPQKNSEIFSILFQNNSLKIESIRSWLKEPGEIYNQEEDEWVLLIQGKAKLKIEDQIFELSSGDYCFISKHTPHQVLSTSKNALWLGIFSS